MSGAVPIREQGVLTTKESELLARDVIGSLRRVQAHDAGTVQCELIVVGAILCSRVYFHQLFNVVAEAYRRSQNGNTIV
jgi:hypothetical protein